MNKTDIFLARGVKANRGDLASQAGIISGLISNQFISNIYVSTYYPHHFNKVPRVKPLIPPILRGMVTNSGEKKILKKQIPVLWGGGVDLQDTGSKIKMPLILLRIILLKRFSSLFILAFQGVGPVNSRFGKFLLKIIANKIDFALVREPTARELLISKGSLASGKINVLSDGALMLEPPDPSFGKEYLMKKGIDITKPVLGLNLRRWFHQKGSWLPTEFFRRFKTNELKEPMKNLIFNITEAIKSIMNKGYHQLVLIPMYRGEFAISEDDIFLLETVQKKLPSEIKSVIVDEDISPQQLLSVFSNLTIMIGVRLHSTILAHVSGVPAVHIYYEHKGRDHFNLMEQGNYLIDINDACSPGGDILLSKTIEKLDNHLKEEHKKIAERTLKLREMALKELDQVLLQIAG